MRKHETKLAGVYVVELEPIYDERGYFARTYDRDTFRRLELPLEVAQTSISHNRLLGTLRGLHWQAAPGTERRLVRVARGRAFEVVVDLRVSSTTFGQWIGVELAAEDGRAVFVPEQCAHGFLTLEDDTEVFLQTSSPHDAVLARGLRWNDPDLAIEWPLAPRVISRRDALCPSPFRDLVVARVA